VRRIERRGDQLTFPTAAPWAFGEGIDRTAQASKDLSSKDLSGNFEFCPICRPTGHFITVESRRAVILVQQIRIRIVLFPVQASTARARSLCAKVDCFVQLFMLQVSVG